MAEKRDIYTIKETGMGAEVPIPGDHCRYCGIDACLMRMRSESQMEGNNT